MVLCFKKERLVFFALLLPLPAFSADPPQSPFLRIEAGAHTGAVSHLAVDAAGDLLATASFDKTIRLWSLPDGHPRGVLRVPIAARQEGELYAVAITPDGKRVFAAGATGGTWDGSFSIYVFDVAKGALVGLLSHLPAPINTLAVSPDGTRFAAGLAQGGVREWDAATGKQLFEDTGYSGPVRHIAFARNGDLFVTAADGHVRAYDKLGAKRSDTQPAPGLHPWGLAVSPDNDLIAVTYDTPDRQGRLRVDLLSSRTLAPVLAPDTSGLKGEGLLAVAWVSDGQGGTQLLAGGYAHGDAGNLIRRWTDFGLGTATDLPAARDTILDLVALPTGGAAYAAEDPGWGLVAPNGGIAQRPSPPLSDLRPARDQRLAVSDTGATIEFATSAGLRHFDATSRQLTQPTAATPTLATPRLTATGLSVTNWKDSSAPRLNNTPLALDKSELSRSLAILPNNTGLILGTDTNLRLYGRDGRQIAAVPVPAAAWAVTVNASSTLAVAALLDGTLRWYGLAPDAPLAERAALFSHVDGVRWVLFTPEGFFDHADLGGKDLVGVHLNRARNQQPEWISFSQAYRALYAPAVARARLLGDAAPAQARLGELGYLRDHLAHQPSITVSSVCVPSPDGLCAAAAPTPGTGATRNQNGSLALPAGATRIRIALALTDHGLGLGPIDAFVNGRNAGRTPPPAATDGQATAQIDIPLDPGEDHVQFRAYDGAADIFTETPELTLAPPGVAATPLPTAKGHGRLFVLAIGIDHFAQPQFELHFGVADATTVADTIRHAAAPLYQQVTITLLTDAQATRAGILAAFTRLATQVGSDDTFLFYVASHGVRSEINDRFLLIPQDVNGASWQTITDTSIDETTLISALAQVRARDALLFLDTCYSGKVTADALANVGHETGRYLLAASSSVQEALDSYDKHNGVFAYAIHEGLAGKAPHGSDGIISALSLGEYMSTRVGELAREKGHEQDAVFKTAQQELRSFPVGEVTP